jgi:hypothetical protein
MKSSFVVESVTFSLEDEDHSEIREAIAIALAVLED